MTADARARGGVAGGFPAAAFILDGDPRVARAAATTYRAVAARAGEIARELTSLRSPSWAGAEGELYRQRCAAHEPLVVTAADTFARLATALDDHAVDAERLRGSMDALRSTAEAIWGQMQTPPRVGPYAARGPAVPGGPSPYPAGAIPPPTSALDEQWRACLAEAARIRHEHAGSVARVVAVVRGLPQPPRVPGTGGGSSSSGSTPSIGAAPPEIPVDADWLTRSGHPYHRALQTPGDQLLLTLGTMYTGVVTPFNAWNLLPLDNSHTFRTPEYWGGVHGKPAEWLRLSQAKTEKLNLALNRAEAAKLAQKIADGAPLTRIEQATATFLAQQMPVLERRARGAQRYLDRVEPIGKAVRGASHVLGGLTIAGDIDTIINPPDKGAVGAIDRGAALLNLGGTAIGMADVAGVIGTTSVIPVVGEVVVLATGAYLTANWAYHNTETVKHAWDATREAGDKALHGDFSGAKEAIEKEGERVVGDMQQDLKGALSTVKDLFS